MPLTSEAQILEAIDQGLIEESHFLDLKKEMKPGKGENKETARDLAQFAVDGGTVIVGIQELDDGSLLAVPQRLHGLPERIEQIASMIPDPPLAVIARPIPTAADPEVGFLVVHVPASAVAPHMVDGRYLGRGDKTKRYLTDGEVIRLHQQRKDYELDTLGLLNAEVNRDLYAGDERQQAHGFLLAEPLTGRAGMLVPLTDVPIDHERLLRFALQAKRPATQSLLNTVQARDFSPDFSSLQSFDRRHGGVAMSTYGIAAGRRLREGDGYTSHESDSELEILDDGGLRIYTSRLTSGRDGVQLFFEAMAVALPHRLLALVEAAAAESGYFGNWALAFGATGLKGAYSFRLYEGWHQPEGSPYSEDVYQSATTTSYAEATAAPGAVVDRLVGRLLRGFSTRQYYLPALGQPPTPKG
jgi:hypothetical protein